MARVVITGIGVVAPCGIGKIPFWENLESGQSYIKHDDEMASLGFQSTVLSRIEDFDIYRFDELSKYPGLATLDRFVQFAIVAAKQAIDDSSLTNNILPKSKTGLIFSSAIGGTASVNRIMAQLSANGLRTIGFLPVGSGLYDAGMFNFPAMLLAQRYGWTGITTSLSTGCTAGIDALGLSFELIQSGEATVMLAGASEAPLVGHAFSTLDVIGALAKVEGEPQKASRPFDAKRNGFVLGEGAAFLVLEEETHALSRGAAIYGEVVSYASTCNAYHMTDLHSDAEEMVLAIQNALDPIGIDEVDYINAHGSSTPMNDLFETNSFKKVFGPRAYSIPISSTKSMIGHSLSAASLMGVIASLGAITRSVIHPTANYEIPDPQCDLDYIPNKARLQPVKTALVCASGFGGIHSAAVFRKYEGTTSYE